MSGWVEFDETNAAVARRDERVLDAISGNNYYVIMKNIIDLYIIGVVIQNLGLLKRS